MVDFGHRMLSYWKLDPDFTYLNHGTVGATPRPVLEAQQRLRDEMESHPSRFMLRELTHQVVGHPLPQQPRMRTAADQVARFFGAHGDDLVFVDNATTGINAILRSLSLSAGDEIVILDHAYGAIAYATSFVARERGARVVTVTLPYPLESSSQAVETIRAAITPKTRLAIIDHVTSESALLLPVKEIAAVCRAAGVLVLIDGAHVPGAIALDIPSLGVDWYVGNMHKWAYAPRGCGILWAAPDRQAGLHPAVISWGLDQGFCREFDWVGTKDPTSYLAAPAGIAFMEELGVEAVQAYNHGLAWEGARMLCRRFGTEWQIPESMIGTMATIPLPPKLGSTKADGCDLRDWLLFEGRIEAQIHAWQGRLWMRLSAQIYNEMADVGRFADAVEARLA